MQDLSKLLDTLISLSPEQVKELCEKLGPCQMSADLYDVLIKLQEFK